MIEKTSHYNNIINHEHERMDSFDRNVFCGWQNTKCLMNTQSDLPFHLMTGRDARWLNLRALILKVINYFTFRLGSHHKALLDLWD